LARSDRKSLSDVAGMLRWASFAAIIPALLLLSPLVGWFLGRWCGGLFHHARAGGAIGVFVGLAAGAMETIDVVKRINRELDQQRKD
jgi:hypothetical protein